MDETILESLKSISSYPVSLQTLTDIAIKRSLSLTDPATPEILSSAPYQLAKADVMMWVSLAPNVSQADVSYNLSPDDKKEWRRQANIIYRNLDATKSITKFGYKGDRL
jgi:hypothetical protein